MTALNMTREPRERTHVAIAHGGPLSTGDTKAAAHSSACADNYALPSISCSHDHPAPILLAKEIIDLSCICYYLHIAILHLDRWRYLTSSCIPSRSFPSMHIHLVA